MSATPVTAKQQRAKIARAAAAQRRAEREAQPPRPGRTGLYAGSRTRTRPSSSCFGPAQRRIIFGRSGGVCALCGRPILFGIDPRNDSAFVAGHVVPHADGGPTTIENSRAECRKCSAREGNRRLRQLYAAKRRRRQLDAGQLTFPVVGEFSATTLSAPEAVSAFAHLLT